MSNLYAQLGNVLRQHCPGWQAAVLSNDKMLLGQTHLNMDTSMSLRNGGIRVQLARGKVK